MLRKASTLVFVALLLSSSFAAQESRRTLSKSELNEVLSAVQDEIYDYDYQGHFYQLGQNVGTPKHWKAQLPIYVDPNLDKDGWGKAIYKLMPYGEILRVFTINEKGLVVLQGNPHNKFPMSQPSTQTVFLDDVEVCEMKHRWRKITMVVDTSPEASVLSAAAKRQQERTGSSNRDAQK